MKLYRPLLILLTICIQTSFLHAQKYHSQNENFVVVVRTNSILFIVDQHGQLVDTEAEYMDASSGLDDYDYYDIRTKKGRIRRIGDLSFDYYDRFDRSELRGKLKSVNNVGITYYDVFDRTELTGKVKSIADIKFSYYDVFDDSSLVGKFKSAGSLEVQYFDRFSDDQVGRIKSVKGNSKNVFLGNKGW